MKTSAAKMTYEQFRLLPDDGKRYELIDGELMMTPAPSPKHQRIVGRLFKALSAHVDANNLGEIFISPVDIVLDEHMVVEPDLVFAGRQQEDIVREEAIHGSPELVIEILSPTSFYHDLRRKMRIYAQFGILEYSIVDPEKETVDVYARAENDLRLTRQFARHETLDSALFPGFRLAVESIF